jgi:hypothetical protein
MRIKKKGLKMSYLWNGESKGIIGVAGNLEGKSMNWRDKKKKKRGIEIGKLV